MPWYGDISNIPSEFAYCDGNNGTPDLRGRTIIGTGNYSDTFGNTTYILGCIGGERMHKLTIEEMPKHNHNIGSYHGGGGYHNWIQRTDVGGSYHLFYSNFSGNDQPHNIMQPYMALNYIMKL